MPRRFDPSAQTVESAGPHSQIAGVLNFLNPIASIRFILLAVKRIWLWATVSLSPAIEKELSS
jgi:hypothetical protein